MKHKTHKLLSILLCTVMMLGILPTMAFADITNKVTIEGVVRPVVGIMNVTGGIQCESHDGTVEKVDGHYWSARKNSTDEWSYVYDDDGSSTVTVDNSPFREGYQYRLSLKVTPNTNVPNHYTYDEATDVVLAGVSADKRTFDGRSITADFIFDGAKENGAFSFDISKTVEQGGSATPGAQSFTFELVDEDGKVPADYDITMDELKVTTNGVGTFTETITGKFGDGYIGGNDDVEKKFTLSEKNDGASGWTYSDQSYVVEISYYPTTGLAFAEVYYGNDAAERTARFTNTYVRNTVTIIEDNEKPEETNPSTGAMVDAPQTNDNSNMILWIALLLISAFGVTGAVVYSKRKKYTE